jgi:ribonuclease D
MEAFLARWIELDKSSQTSNWSRRPIEADQLRYATLDIEVLIRLHGRFAATESGTPTMDGARG